MSFQLFKGTWNPTFCKMHKLLEKNIAYCINASQGLSVRFLYTCFVKFTSQHTHTHTHACMHPRTAILTAIFHVKLG